MTEDATTTVEKTSTTVAGSFRALVGIAGAIAVVVTTCCHHQMQSPPSTTRSSSHYNLNLNTTLSTASSKDRGLLVWNEDEEEEIVAMIREKLQPKELMVDNTGVLVPHQFLHLHNMKTGGTSLDHLLKCARERLEADFGYTTNHYSIHECARGKFQRCVANVSDPCRSSMDQAGTMSFCSALKHLHRFGWDDEQIRAVTVLRHPVERVWSMFRFEPRMCYNCRNLTDIYDMIDGGDTTGYDSLCLAQLQNHETANLLSSDWPEDATDDEIVAEAIKNLKSAFTVIGLTEELTISKDIIGSAFPWVNKTYKESRRVCSLPHDNSSPTNNHCIKNNRTDGRPGIITTHWDLPSHPDEETRKAIEAHNQLDLRLYEAAVQYFELQKRAWEANQEEA
eukprot:Nitzschia sp. Nitz4//scaffold181_size46380//25685//26866//NITZ4_007178-RA/size46380-processed-gene-0.33-mRNA-1//-1//CDS//3329539513//7153//frame0